MYGTILKTQKDVEADYRRTAQRRGADPDEAVPPSVIGRYREVPKEAPPPEGAAPPKTPTINSGRAELKRLMDAGLSREAALAEMKRKGWK